MSHQGEAGNSVGACRSRGDLLSETNGASPRLVPYMNPGRKNRGMADSKGRLSLMTPSQGALPAFQMVSVQIHGSFDAPLPAFSSHPAERPISLRGR